MDLEKLAIPCPYIRDNTEKYKILNTNLYAQTNRPASTCDHSYSVTAKRDKLSEKDDCTYRVMMTLQFYFLCSMPFSQVQHTCTLVHF